MRFQTKIEATPKLGIQTADGHKLFYRPAWPKSARRVLGVEFYLGLRESAANFFFRP